MAPSRPRPGAGAPPGWGGGRQPAPQMATAPARVRDSQVDAATSRPRDPASCGSPDRQSGRCDGVFDGLLERVQELRTGRTESEQSHSEDDCGRGRYDTEADAV